jgi:histidine triad (HIT) family protein
MSQHDPTCLFCRIVRGEIPAARVLDTDTHLAFLDINPVNHGHTLLIPKDHHATLSDVPPDTAADLGRALPALCRAVREATGAPGLNVIVNHGAIAGQTIDHVHYHVIPRHDGDAVHWPWPHVAYPEGALDALRAKIAAALQSA